ncbi:Rhodanese-like protein [Conidiobolus coronatus NRRL 28638]|uniref:Rhodanese-like protein n=1 Tax=Conidiobolus coronatus (strain ATCC 28846 / CBS 209.66 / NRRL 28638) TaxID=796925 RepID=A0A137P407_CONC2|nr:Rhodanese-like protein [Conidiobolus coronatus NRRL 28638]|eukprot:KXN69736.1 Rhodanese-like protein [Conidiobolus coronatus NRRL 28638]
MKELVPPLVTTDYVSKNLNNITLVDSTWYFPNLNKDAFEEFQLERLPNSKFLSILELRDKTTELPNMLPSPKEFAQYMENIKISPSDHIVLYDKHGVFSSPRAYWIFNHDKVSILNGGFPKWKAEDRELIINKQTYLEELNEQKSVNYPIPTINQEFITNYDTVINLVKNANNGGVQLIDARPTQLYNAGHIPQSKSFSFDKVLEITPEGYKQFKTKSELSAIIFELELNLNAPLIGYCAIAMTACIVFFAIKYASQFELDSVESSTERDEDSNLNIKVYDGSWAEYSKREDSIIST